ncbi:hypothetical protein HDU67_006853 [Dinochytrium kinnereticum]|nr:hypothetical protein HDU67_006853 [Dinochytrium kinnereticum]
MQKTPKIVLKNVRKPEEKTPKIVLKNMKRPDEKTPSSSRKRKADNTDDSGEDSDVAPPKAKKGRADWVSRTSGINFFPSAPVIDKWMQAGSISKEDFTIPVAELKDKLLKLTNAIRQATDKNVRGRVLCTLFKALPSKAHYPDYFELIKNPICLNQIQTKIHGGKYASPKELREDVILLFNNAREYNVSGSQVFTDAEHLMAQFDVEYDKLKSEMMASKKKTTEIEEKKDRPLLKLIPPKRKDTPKKTPVGTEMEVDEQEETEQAKAQRKPAKVVPEVKPPEKDEDDIHLLFKAIEENNVKAADRILKKGVNPNYLFETTVDGKTLSWTPLHAAAYHARTRILDILVHGGASLDIGDTLYNNKALHWAVVGNGEGVAKRLVRTHHANRQPKNGKGQIPLELIPPGEPDAWKEILAPETVTPAKKESHAITPGSDKKGSESKGEASRPVREAREKRAVRERQKEEQEESTRHGKKLDSAAVAVEASKEKKAPSDVKIAGEARGFFGTKLRSMPYILQRPLSPPPDPRGSNQLLIPAGKGSGSRVTEAPSRLVKDIMFQVPDIDFSVSLGQDFRARAISVPSHAVKANVSVYAAPAPKGVFYSFCGKHNRQPLNLAPADDGHIGFALELVDGINAIEVTVAAYKGDGDDYLLLTTAKEDHQKLVFIIQKQSKRVHNINDVNFGIREAVAKKVPFSHNYLGTYKLPDDYHWLKDQTPGPGKREDILEHLKLENEYCADVHLKPNEVLINKLYEEFLARIKEDDEDVPAFKAPYWYYTKTTTGLQYKTYCRRFETMDAPEEEYLDPNKMKDEYIEIGAVKISSDQKTLAYSIDTVGDERFKIYLKNLENGDVKGPVAENCGGSIAWDNLNSSFYYDVIDEAQRMYAIKRHIIGGTEEDKFIYIEDDRKFMVSIWKTNSDRFILITSGSFKTTEVRYIDAQDPDAGCKLFCPRETGHKYDVEHHENRFLILTDGGGKYLNNKLQSCPLDNTSRGMWTDVIPYDPYRHIEEHMPFENFITLIERSDGLRRLRVVDAKNPSDNYLVDFPEDVFTVGSENLSVQNYKSNTYRFNYSSFLTPRQTWNYDFKTQERTLLKQIEIPGGFDSSAYTMKRIYADIPEETIVDAPFDTPVPKKIPITVLYKTDLFHKDGSNPCLLYGYGSYGVSIDPVFDTKKFSYVDRGFVYIVAHIRGGGENGRGWYETGKLMHKKNTFTDFVTAADYVVNEKYADRSKLVIEGRSAGGLLIGAVLNLRPDISKLAIAGVPFVDVINTMMDDTIPLTVNEYEEWGNPNEPEAFEYMLSYSPYENIKPGVLYPNLLILAGLTDPRVPYWEPSKWTAKLREIGVNENSNKESVHRIVYNCKMGSGHFGASGRYGYLKEIAADYAYVITEILGKEAS